MRYLLLLLAVLVCAPASFAQEKDYSNWEFYGGYAYERAPNGAKRLNPDAAITFGTAIAKVNFASERVNYNGFSTEVVGNFNRHLGLVGNFTLTWNGHVGYFDTLGGGLFDARVRRWQYFVGPRFNLRNGTRLIPFGEALVGVTRFDAKFRQAVVSTAKTENAFSMALGGGLDIRASRHIDLRAGQVDYVPIFFKNQREDSFRVSAGIKVKTAPATDDCPCP